MWLLLAALPVFVSLRRKFPGIDQMQAKSIELDDSKILSVSELDTGGVKHWFETTPISSWM